MQDAFRPLSQMEYPSFYPPGVHPIGRMQVNWDHPLSKGLASAYLGGDDFDMVSNSALVLKGGAHYYAPDHLGSTGGTGCYAITTTIIPPHTIGLSSFSIYQPGTTLTVRDTVWSIVKGATPEHIRGVLHGYTNSDRVFSYISSADAWYTLEQSAGFFVAGEKMSVGISHNKAANTVVYYKNGAFVVGAGGASTNADSLGYVMLLGTLYAVRGRSGINSRLYLNYIWYDRILTASEHKSLQNDPYQLLMPAINVVKPRYVSTFKVAYAQGSNSIVGGNVL